MISQKQRDEWLFENPVTQDFRETIQSCLDEFLDDKGIESYHRGEPHKTQEALAEISGAIQAFEIVLEALGEDSERIREEGSGEQE